MVARQTLTLLVQVQSLLPQPSVVKSTRQVSNAWGLNNPKCHEIKCVISRCKVSSIRAEKRRNEGFSVSCWSILAVYQNNISYDKCNNHKNTKERLNTHLTYVG